MESNIDKFMLSTMKPFTKFIDGWIVPSKYYFEVLKNYLGNKYKQTSILIYPSGGVNTKLFRPLNREESRKKLNLESSDFVVGWVSRIDKDKGWEIFLRAIYKASAFIPNLRAVVAGSGNDEIQFKRALRKFNLEDKVIMLGNIEHNQLPYVYNAMDVFIFPTMRESLGLVGLEALACGVPVIASRVEGPMEYLKEGVNGFLFEPGNAENLSNKIVTFYNLSNNRKEEMKRRSSEVALKYDSYKVNQDLLKFLLEVYSENNRNS